VCSLRESLSLARYKTFKEVSSSTYETLFLNNYRKVFNMSLKAAHIVGIKFFTKNYYQQKIQELKYLTFAVVPE